MVSVLGQPSFAVRLRLELVAKSLARRVDDLLKRVCGGAVKFVHLVLRLWISADVARPLNDVLCVADEILSASGSAYSRTR